MKKVVMMMAIMICFMIVITSCGVSQREREQTAIEHARQDSIAKVKEDSLRNSLILQVSADSIRFNELVKNFEHDIDEFDESREYYSHKFEMDNLLVCCLNLEVRGNGTYYLRDTYYGDDWCFHTNIEVKVGTKVFKSATVELNDDLNYTHYYGGSVWEKISYLGEKDNGIIEAIVNSSDGAKILLRFNGEYYHDIELTQKNIKALKESYELAQILQRRQEYKNI